MAILPRWRRGASDRDEGADAATEGAPADAPVEPAEPARDDVTAPTVTDFEPETPSETATETEAEPAPPTRPAPRGVKPRPRPEAPAGDEPAEESEAAAKPELVKRSEPAQKAEPAKKPEPVTKTEPVTKPEPVKQTEPVKKTEPVTAKTKATTSPTAEPDPEPDADGRSARLRLSILDSTPVALFMAAHPKQAVVTALGMGVAALASGRPLREAAVVAATVAIGQTILGWHNDIVDRERDARHATPRKPVAEGRVDAGTVWYALVVAVLLVIPLSISTGVTAGTFYLGSLVIGILGNVVLRAGVLSFVPWAASFALYPAYLSYGGWGGSAEGDPPQVAIVVVAGLLGIGVHVVRAIWGLVADEEDGWSYVPLRLGRRLGASRLLVVAGAYTAAVIAVLAIVGSTVGLRQ